MLRTTIDLSDIEIKYEDGMATYSDETQDQLRKLLEAKKAIADIEAEVKIKIAECLLSFEKLYGSTPQLTKSGDVRTYFREYGATYIVDPTRVTEVESKYVSKEIKYVVNKEEVEAHIELTGQVPLGIEMPERKKVVSLRLMEVK